MSVQSRIFQVGVGVYHSSLSIKILTSNLVEKSIGTYISHQLCDEYVKVDLLSYLYVDKKSDDDNNDAVVNVC